MFITLEGPDGGGKTTQAQLLIDRLQADGLQAVLVHEPGGTDLGDSIRELLVRRNWTPIDPWAEALLFSACRAQLVSEVVTPALQRGAVVVADRFSDSTLAYQGAGRGLPRPDLAALIRIATNGVKPDLTFLLDVSAEIGIARLKAAGKAQVPSAPNQLAFFEELRLPEDWNRFEDEPHSFHTRVRDAYLELARVEPGRWVVVDATQPVSAVAAQVWDAVSAQLRQS